LLEASLADEPSSEATRRLAEIERGAGDRTGAAARLKASLDLPEAKNDRALEIELRVTLSDILRESGQRDAAREELLHALRSASAVTSNLGDNQARFERAVARTLDRLGEDAASARAFERALAASSDDAQKSVTLLEAMMRAVLNADVFAARKYARKARELSIRNEDLVYAGLWLMLLERELKERPDGTAAEILINIPTGPRWFSKLAAWSQGKLSDTELTTNARTFSQKVEAEFYLTLAQRASGATGLEVRLEGVARSGAFDLFELQFARDLLAGATRKLTGALPADINLPGLNHPGKPTKTPAKAPPLPPAKGPVQPVAPK
jgi:tetratricopeptide (TPR) repeat protein